MAIDQARSALFVPGDRPERFDRAARAGADLVIIDLEDAVRAEHKERARQHARAWLQRPGCTAVVRVNGAATGLMEADLDAVGGLAAGVMLPKCEDPRAVERVRAAADRLPVVALMETAAGVIGAPAIARCAGVVRLAFGNVDLAADLGVDPDDRVALSSARSALVLASAAAGIAGPLDGVTTQVRDSVRTRGDAEHARRLGMVGKLCIHPAQVAVVNEVMAPTPEAIAWAQAVLDSETGGVAVLDGQMIDAPVVARARRILGE